MRAGVHCRASLWSCDFAAGILAVEEAGCGGRGVDVGVLGAVGRFTAGAAADGGGVADDGAAAATLAADTATSSARDDGSPSAGEVTDRGNGAAET